jgi:hypothetical protein
VDDEFSDEIQIQQGVRKDFVLSPLSFNIYSEAISEEAMLSSMNILVLK